MRLSLLIAVAAVLAFVGCKKDEKVTPSGYTYIVQKSTGGAKPNPGDYVYFHAQARNGDSVVYSSRMVGQEPFLQIPKDDQSQAGRTPSPVEEVLRDMAVGDSITVIVKLDTLPQKPPGFENAKELYYDVVMINIKSEEQFNKDSEVERQKLDAERIQSQAREKEVADKVAQVVKDYNSGALASQLKTTGSGLKYLILEEGTGKQAQNDRLVNVHYYGVLKDGTMFDNSFGRGMPFSFALGKNMVIKGWDEGIALLKEGGKAVLFIPSDLGYGKAGSPPVIPANAELIFYVELQEVK
ncbi:MAG: FKBP-type peptidyl-prolyl cis-trans isomerase [Saprospiraceae bacterium]